MDKNWTFAGRISFCLNLIDTISMAYGICAVVYVTNSESGLLWKSKVILFTFT